MESPAQIVEELQRIAREMEKGANALYDAEVKLADAEAAYDKAVSLSFLNSSGTVADRQAVAKLQAVEEKLKADLARAEFNRVKTKMKLLSDTATMTAVISRNVELQWRS
jgi:exonuclease VII small subunit